MKLDIDDLKSSAYLLKGIIDAQANDDDLWFIPQYATEDKLQLALRLLTDHTERLADIIIESTDKE